MNSIGETLRRAREEKGLSLEDVSRATKVKYEILQKLEADDFENLVSPTYTRGFIKLYGEHLGLNGQQLSEGYVSSQGGLRRRGLHVETVASTRRKRELSLPLQRVVALVAGLTVLIVLIALITRFMSGGEEHTAVATVAVPVATGSGATLPDAGFEAYYQPATKPAPAMLEIPASRE